MLSTCRWNQSIRAYRYTNDLVQRFLPAWGGMSWVLLTGDTRNAHYDKIDFPGGYTVIFSWGTYEYLEFYLPQLNVCLSFHPLSFRARSSSLC